MMAKKKSKAKKRVHKSQHKSEPKKSSSKKKKESGSTGWVIGIIIVVVIIIAILLLMRGCAKEDIEQQPEVTPPTEQPPAETEPSGPEVVSDVPTTVRYCSIDYAIGWPEYQLADPCEIEGNEALVSLIYSGKAKKISGMWFEVTMMDGTKSYLKDTRDVNKGEIVEYSIPDMGQKIDTMLALPMIEEDGEDKACLNQRLLVVKATNCVRD